MRNLRTWSNRIFSVIIAFCAVALPAKAEEDEPFSVGGSCAALAYTTSAALADLLNETYADDLGSFCVPEEAMECGDYTPFLKGRGRLITGEDGYHCTLQVVR